MARSDMTFKGEFIFTIFPVCVLHFDLGTVQFVKNYRYLTN